MKKVYKLLIIFLFILMGVYLVINSLYADTIECDENTIIISQCTSNMRGLETGISVYAGYKNTPIILSDKKIPEQIDNWLGSYISDNNITKVIIVGNLDFSEIIKLKIMGLDVKVVSGDSISQILTKVADNVDDKNNDTVIFTSSDPLAGFMGAYMKTPVFITANNSSYNSSDKLDDNYINYLDTHKIKHIIVVGSLPENIIKKLGEYNQTVEIITADSTAQLSINVNQKLKTMGYINSSNAYYGFYGEIPAVIPKAVEDNAYLIEDSSFDTASIDYLRKNNVTDIYLTRNTESDYIQMEETDYISSNVIDKLRNNFNITFLTKKRTLDEATGLYDTKMILLESMSNHLENNQSQNNLSINATNTSKKTLPPLLAMLEHKKVVESNNITADITLNDNNTYTVKWNTIHPYTWIKYNDTFYYATSNTGYEYYWNYYNNSWHVDYKYNNTTYYNITWIENKDNTWLELQANKNYTWSYDLNKWNCYNNEGLNEYSLSIIE